MREFAKVSPGIWQARLFRELATDQERLLYLYLMTCGQQSSAGCCLLPPGYACADLGWNLEVYMRAREALVQAGLAAYDAVTHEVLIVDWFALNAPQNEKHKIGTARLIAKIQSPALREQAEAALDAAWRAYIDGAAEKVAMRASSQRVFALPTSLKR
jgi:hypothetical protein